MNKLNKYTICGKEASATSQVCHNARMEEQRQAVMAALWRRTEKLKKVSETGHRAGHRPAKETL